MNPKAELRPYLQTDIDDILEALVDDQGNVNGQIMLNLNGRNRLVNVGLIRHMTEWLYVRPDKRPMQEVIADICECAFVDYVPQKDTLQGVPLPRKLLGVGATKRGNRLTVSARYQSCINGRAFGPNYDVHYFTDSLTKFQQSYIMHLLLSLGDGGHAGQGMADWDLYFDSATGETRFNQDLSIPQS